MKLCSPQVGLDPGTHLGGAVHDWEVLREVGRRGSQIHILLPRGALCDRQPGWEIHRTPAHRLSFYEYNFIFARFLLKHGHAWNLDLLRVHSPYAVGPGVLYAARRLGLPVVAHYHHLEDKSLYHAINRWTVGRYQALITVSQFSKDQIARRYGVERDRIHVVPNGVDAERFRPLEDGLPIELTRLEPGARVLVFIGSLIRRKNVAILPTILARLRSRHPHLHLLVAGEGPERGTLVDQARRCDVADRVHPLGAISEDQKVRLLNRAEVFLFPSRVEGFGIAAAEAMACGTPVVAARAGGLSEVVEDNLTGWLCDPEDPEAFATAVDRLLQDPALGRSMGEAGRRRVLERFCWESAGARILEIYERTAAEGTCNR